MADRAEIHQKMEYHVRELKSHEEKHYTRCVADAAGQDQPEGNMGCLRIKDRETKYDHPAHREIEQCGKDVGKQ